MPRRPFPLGAYLAPACLCLAIVARPARGQRVPAECRVPIDAERKETVTPHHAYSTEGPPGAAAQGRTRESVMAGGAMFVQYAGRWRRSPLTPRMQLDQMQENLDSAKVLTCRRVGEESVGGEAAVVYFTHTVNSDLAADARIWVATRSGLPLRIEEDVDTSPGAADGKRHISIRFDYANVRAPAGVP